LKKVYINYKMSVNVYLENFIYYHILVLKPFLKCAKNYTQHTNRIATDYFNELYIDDDIPALWVEALSKALNIYWKAPSDDLSETASES
jgi:hypothetical protein